MKTFVFFLLHTFTHIFVIIIIIAIVFSDWLYSVFYCKYIYSYVQQKTTHRKTVNPLHIIVCTYRTSYVYNTYRINYTHIYMPVYATDRETASRAYGCGDKSKHWFNSSARPRPLYVLRVNIIVLSGRRARLLSTPL